MAKKISARQRQAIKKAGLPAPATESPAQFAKLQKEWYAKLGEEGFKDIEWVDHSTGTGHNSPYLRGSLAGGKAYHAGRELYYQLASNYLQHCKNLRNNAYNRFIWQLHTDGHTYDEIADACKARFKSKAVSKYTLYYQLQRLAKACYRWNQRADEGLLRKRAEDSAQKEQSIVAEFDLPEYNWLINEQFALEGAELGKKKKIKR
jgi:hypothetical protein